MVGFVLNGFVFVLIGLELPDILAGLAGRSPGTLAGCRGAGRRASWSSRGSCGSSPRACCPNSPRRVIARRDPRLARRLTFVVGWAGLRGAVSLAAALALPADFPERNLILLVTFAVILVTLVGQGLTLPAVLRWAALGWRRSPTATRRPWPGPPPTRPASTRSNARGRCGRPTSRCSTGWSRACATGRSTSPPEDADETAERRQERIEHEEIQRGVIAAQRAAVIELRDEGEINDETLRDDRARAGPRRAADGGLSRQDRRLDRQPVNGFPEIWAWRSPTLSRGHDDSASQDRVEHRPASAGR